MGSIRARTTLVAAAMGALLLPFGVTAPAQAQSFTSLPELQAATVVSLRTQARASATEPAGMSIAFAFDETLGTGAPVPDDFLVYSWAGVASHATDVQVEGHTATAFFPGVDTGIRASRVSLAVVEEGAVRDADGNANPIGSSSIVRRWHQGSKNCIKLLRANHLRHRRHRTIVNFVFTPLTTCGDDPAGAKLTVTRRRFHLEMRDGRSIPAVKVHYRSAHLATSNHPLVVHAVFRGWRIRSHISRVTDRGALAYYWWGPGSDDDGYEGSSLEARTISHRGRTARPDLVSVTLQPSGQQDEPGHAMFVFDQRVSRPRGQRFSLDEVPGGRASVVPHHPRQVRVTFSPDTVSKATDATVQGGAVRGGRADEVPVRNTVTYTTTTDARTDGPDLMSGVYLNHTGPVSAAFLFDAELAGVPDPAAFHLYTPDGTKYDAERCSQMAMNPAVHLGRVRCIFPRGVRVATGHAQLVTVGAGAVQDKRGRANPEGAAPTYAPAATPGS